ncbi:hypothetical protein [Methylobacterium sp. NEAU K]|uniref:DUF6894 family protein n=1 Tax=Methylobacterium sp. NEAU K TaxID=3064946 RepID=UPI0027359BF9|nr:hypothetical protein [Methylobacterium sp. NEAU K]MDP4002927.1 hypothetical protein [Methylobacterium sp. NEAU K]
MARFYFHVFSGRTVIDTTGIDLPDAALAREEAVRLAGTLLKEEASTIALGQSWEMSVTEGDGRVLFRLSVSVSGS